MPLTFPKVLRPLDLGEYGSDYEGMVLTVWVNPPREVRERWVTISGDIRDSVQVMGMEERRKTDDGRPRMEDGGRTTEDGGQATKEHVERIVAAGKAAVDWLAEILGQGDEETRCNAEQLMELADASPGLFGWIFHGAYFKILEHRRGKKKG